MNGCYGCAGTPVHVRMIMTQVVRTVRRTATCSIYVNINKLQTHEYSGGEPEPTAGLRTVWHGHWLGTGNELRVSVGWPKFRVSTHR